MSRKTLYTLNLGMTYAPEITAITYPLIKYWAWKMGAEFVIIDKPKRPNFVDERGKHVAIIEKFQVWDMAEERHDEWSIFLDSDALVHPNMFDITEFLAKSEVMHFGLDMANQRWRFNNYHRRDGRNIGSCTWFCVCSDWTRDLWNPELIPETAVEVADNISITAEEAASGVKTRESLADDFLLSQNIARFGLKFKHWAMIMQQVGWPPQGPSPGYFWHQYLIREEQKVVEMKKVMRDQWKLPLLEGTP